MSPNRTLETLQAQGNGKNLQEAKDRVSGSLFCFENHTTFIFNHSKMAIDDPFEYLSFGATLGRTFSLLFDRFDFFMGVSLIVIIPYAVTSLIRLWLSSLTRKTQT